jgi:hypothetical protein
MILYQSDIHNADGAFSDLFANQELGRAYKLFIGPRHARKPYPESDETRRRKAFASECDAYNIVSGNGALKICAPLFYGTLVVTDVIGRAGDSVKDQYLLNCCYEMEFLIGPSPVKIGVCTSSGWQHISDAQSAFWKAGIKHMTDCSVFFPEDTKKFKIIDFATEEFELFF